MRERKRLPRTYEAAVRRANEFGGRVLWPPITESIRTLEATYEHLRGVWPTLSHRREHRRRYGA